MSTTPFQLETSFPFGDTTVEIILGDISRLHIPNNHPVHFVVSSDDNYLTMGSGVSAALRDLASDDYAYEAQAQGPVIAGTPVVTKPYGICNAPGFGAVQRILHGTVVDYDTSDYALHELVNRTTTNCLVEAVNLGDEILDNGTKADELGILLPAFGSGSGGLGMEDCAMAMCSAINAFLTRDQPFRHIFILLYGGTENMTATEKEALRKGNKEFVTGANKVLDVPNDPVRLSPRAEDFWEHRLQTDLLQELIRGKNPDGKKHAFILGGPKFGKSVLLDQLYVRSLAENAADKIFARLSFGSLHANTPAPFIYQKLLVALAEHERDPDIRAEIGKVSAEICKLTSHHDPKQDARESGDLLVKFFKRAEYDKKTILFFIDRLPLCSHSITASLHHSKGVEAFWEVIDYLEENNVRLIATTCDDVRYKLLLDQVSSSFKENILEVRLAAISPEDRREWVNRVFQRYLHRDATRFEREYIKDEGGCHPYLINLALHALVTPLKLDIIENQRLYVTSRQRACLAPFLRQARRTLDEPCRNFFDSLMSTISIELYNDLRNLSQAVAMEEERAFLLDEKRQLLKEQCRDRNVDERLKDLFLYAENYRINLHRPALIQLTSWGCLTIPPLDPNKENFRNPAQRETRDIEKVNFIARSFWLYVREYFRTMGIKTINTKDLNISLRWIPDFEEDSSVDCEDPGGNMKPELSGIQTMLNGRGARVLTSRNHFTETAKQEFMRAFQQLLSYTLHPAQGGRPPSVFNDLEEVGNYILSQFTTGEIKRHLQRLPMGSTILLMVDDKLKEIPWELMLESAYGGEIPFRVGRKVITSRALAVYRDIERRPGNIRALLIGDPTGTDVGGDEIDDGASNDAGTKLLIAREEVKWLHKTLTENPRFSEPDILIGAEQCKRIRIITLLASGKYDLIHYSGHSKYDGMRSGWLLSDGLITTDDLTKAVEMDPPKLVFSSSCESAGAGKIEEITFEGQTFDLPSAYLQAGVECYIGTQWNVYEQSAYNFAQEFYSAFLTTDYNIGECMRRAKWALKQSGDWRDRIHWLPYVLYGDPRTTPADLFPIMGK